MAMKTFRVKNGKFEEYMSKPLVCGDLRAYKIVLETDYDLDGHSVKITAKRGDGAVFDDIGVVSGRNAEYVIKSDIYAVEGEVEIRVVIISPEGNRLTDKALVFEVLSAHETGDMLAAGDGGKSIADLAITHIYDTENPHNVTAEQLGLGMVLEGWENKIDFAVVYSLPSLSVAKENTLYFVYRENSDWSIDNTDAIRYDLYIKTPNLSDGSNIYAWTKLSVGEVDSVPTQNSGKCVTSGGVYSAINDEITARKEADNVVMAQVSTEKKQRQTACDDLYENIADSKTDILNTLSTLYMHGETVKVSKNVSIGNDSWYTLPEEVPENVLFFVENDTDTAICEFREYDNAAIKLSVPIEAGETRLCVLTKRETASIDLNEDGYIFVLDKPSALPTRMALISDITGNVSVSTVTDTELGYLDGVTSSVQTQLDAKAPKSHASTATTYGAGTASYYGHVKLSDSVSSTSSTGSGVAATPKAVKQAYDLALEAKTVAENGVTADVTERIEDIENSLCTNGYAGGEEITADLSELQSAFYSGKFAGATEVVQMVSELANEKAVYSSTSTAVPDGYYAPTSVSEFPTPTDGIDIELMRGIYNISSVITDSAAGVYRYVGQGACDIAANLPSDSQYKSMTTVKVGAALSDYAIKFSARAHLRFENIVFIIDKTSNYDYGLLKMTAAGACVEFVNCAFVFNTGRLFYFYNGNARFTNCDFYCTATTDNECVHIIEQYNSGRIIIDSCRIGHYGTAEKCYLNNMSHYGSYGLSNSALNKVNPVRIDTSVAVGEKVRIVGNLIEAASIGHDTTSTPSLYEGASMVIADNDIIGTDTKFIAMPLATCTLCNNAFGVSTPVNIYCCGQYTTISANSGGKVKIENYRGNTAVTGNSFVSYTKWTASGNVLETGNLPTA